MAKTVKSVVLDSKFEALNEKQELIKETFQNHHQILLGSAGTGKTYAALKLSLQEVLDRTSVYKKIVIVRSSVPTREVGFLKGTLEEKLAVYEIPYINIIADITKPMPTSDRETFDSNYDKLKHTDRIEFESTSYLRGTTFDNCIMIFDECQSASFHELDTVIGRVGQHTKLIFCGDTKQNDLKPNQSGLAQFLKIIDVMETRFNIVVFKPEDCVRSGLVRDYLLTKEILGI